MISKSGLLIVLMIFYGLFTTIYGMFFYDINNLELKSIGFSDITFNNIVIGVSNAPILLNIVVFLPLFLGFLFIIISSLPTFNGGS